MYKFGVSLFRDSHLGLANLYAIFKVKLNLTVGFGSFGFVCFDT